MTTLFCPECRAEYRKGFTRCSDCDVPLVASLPPEDVKPAGDTEEVVVFVAADMVEADAVKGLLEGSGIGVYLSGESSPLPGIPGSVDVVVSGADAGLAQELIEEYQADSADARGYVPSFPPEDDEHGGSQT